MFEIKKIDILIRKGHTDFIYLKTDKPYPFSSFVSSDDDTLSVKFETPHGKGKEYVEKHFPGVSIKIIDDSE